MDTQPTLSYRIPQRLRRGKPRILALVLHGTFCAAIFVLLLFPWYTGQEFSGGSGVSHRQVGLLNAIEIVNYLKRDPATHRIIRASTELQPHWISLGATLLLVVLAIASFLWMFKGLLPGNR